MSAVLEDAIRVFRKNAGVHTTRARRLFDETAEWFESSDVSWPFSFENICDVLVLDPAWIRAQLRRWLARHARPAQRRIAESRQRAIGGAPDLRIAC